MKLNRNQRRRQAAQEGKPWRKAQEERLFREGRERAIENAAIRMTPQEAREALAAWAAIPGRSQKEVDAMNARAHGGQCP